VDQIKVSSIMVPLAEYAVVSDAATLLEAVNELEAAQHRFCENRYKHRAILVTDADGQVIGKLSANDVLMGLEPGYRNVASKMKLSHWELSEQTIRGMMSDYQLWDKPLEDICRKAVQIKVKDIMYTPSSGEYVDQDATLDEAIHQLVIGRHQSLLVVDAQRRVVGILRLTDVFTEVTNRIKSCQL